MQPRKPKIQMYLKSNVYNFILHTIGITANHVSAISQISDFFYLIFSTWGTVNQPKTLWALSLLLRAFDISYVYKCDVLTKRSLWSDPGMQISQERWKFPFAFIQNQQPKQEIVWTACRSSNHATDLRLRCYCTLNSECGLFGPLSARLRSAEYCCGINICNASSLQQLLHAWNDLDPLNSELFS